jgi:tetratricopeptide (TPR) repeat protein
MRRDSGEYKKQMQFCLNEGNLVNEEDQSAQYEAENIGFVNTYLLRSRLLFDGGYYNNALSEITARKIEDFPKYNDQLEVTYRLGRIMQMNGKIEKAISYFKTTIKNGTSSESYFAANSALMIGIIYEERDQNQKAIAYFKKCLSMDYKQYKNSIDQKAKAGLDRIKLREKKR